jgi:hypothetical protein
MLLHPLYFRQTSHDFAGIHRDSLNLAGLRFFPQTNSLTRALG